MRTERLCGMLSRCMSYLCFLASPACLACPGCESPVAAPAAAAALTALLPADVATPGQQANFKIMHKVSHASSLVSALGCSHCIPIRLNARSQHLPSARHLNGALYSKFDVAEGHTRDPMDMATPAVIHVKNRVHIGLRLRLKAAGHSHRAHATDS